MSHIIDLEIVSPMKSILSFINEKFYENFFQFLKEAIYYSLSNVCILYFLITYICLMQRKINK